MPQTGDIAVAGGEVTPFQRFGFIRPDALSGFIHQTQSELGIGILAPGQLLDRRGDFPEALLRLPNKGDVIVVGIGFMFGRGKIPSDRLRVILLGAESQIIKMPKIQRCPCDIAIVGGFQIPAPRFAMIPAPPQALPVNITEAELGAQMAVLGGLAIPNFRGDMILGNAMAIIQHRRESKLGIGQAAGENFIHPLRNISFVRL